MLILIFCLSGLAFPQFTEFHPELDWYTIKGEHVEVHYHNGVERTAKVVAKIADDVWEPICSLYGYEPEVVHYVIKDIDDYSNGATYFFDNKIEIWTSALDFDLRGTHNWLRNVISHEFTHMVQIQASMKSSRGLPAVFLQVLNYEDERRPDILYGFPNFIVSYPLATINVPAWYAEGTAQYMRKEFDYDQWDSHRDMILRSYALDGNMLSWNQMGVFGKTSLGNESVYNSGFALTRYIAQKYGEKKLAEISKALGNFWNFTIDAAFEDAIGKDGNEIYSEWKDFVTKSYFERTTELRTNLITGDTLAKEGFGNFYPVFSEDDSKFIYISNKSSDYFGLSRIYLYNLKTKEEKMLVSNVRSIVEWIPGKNKIIYAKLSDDNQSWYNVHDLYVYDIDKDEETRLTYNLRANQPAISNDGKKIVFLFQKDGTTNIGLVDFNVDSLSTSGFRQLTAFNNGEQVYNPKFSNDDSYIVFDYSYHHTRDIVRINFDGSGYEEIISTNNDERNPLIDKDGNLVYASDETGIFNIYRYDFKTKQKTKLTNVLGGAFMPSVSDNGDILYAGYTSSGYKIFHIIPEQQGKVIAGKDYIWMNNPPLDVYSTDGDVAALNINRLKNFNDNDIPKYEKKSYGGVFSKLTFFPFIRYDNYNTSNKFLEKIKPGLLVTSSDMLNRYALFAGGSINSRLERDLFLIFDYRNKLPLLFNLGIKPELSLELYNISRKADVDVNLGEYVDTAGVTRFDYTIPTDVTYNLFEVDFIAKHRIFSRDQALEFRFAFSRYSAALGSFILPDNTLYPTLDDTYLIGRNFQLKYTLDAMLPYVDAEINPVGVHLGLTYNYEFNKFNSEGNYVVEDGLLKPSYNNFNFHRLELNSKLHFPLWANHTITAQLRGGSILGPAVPDFFDFYLGGLIGMKAYTFYAISGNEIAWLNLTYRFPLFRNIDARAGHLYLDKIYFSVYGDLGNAWTGKIPELNSFKKGAGAELRIQLSSYYLFPTSIFLNAAYGFDKFDRVVNNEIITYGKEWQFYGGILFGFDI
ncbi:MAG: biopolymer transporter Tol [Ignavibacteria bacterium RBG_16_34_14]|nr:MAG: biopolymer transporter Tol [Ignavibacteria bacterium RBG_16_34_14]